MSRPLRIQFPGALYHITSRGNARQSIFLDSKDFSTFLDLLEREIAQQHWICYAYCLMNNHYHLLIETPEGNLVKGMRGLNGVYTQYFNRRHKRVGHLFQGRYKSIIVDKDNYLLELCRYIVLNPLRAKVVKRTEQWKWSSYGVTIGKVTQPDWINSKTILEHFGKSKNRSIESYKRFVKDGIGNERPWINLRGQIWLGEEKFVKKIQGHIGDRKDKEIPSDKKHPLRPQKEDILEVLEREYKVDRKRILKRENKKAYMCGVYILRRICNLGIKEVSEMFNISESMVSKVQRQVEKGEIKDKRLDKLLYKYKVQT